LLAKRRPISVAEYEAMRSGAESDVSRAPEGFQGRFTYAGTERDRRRYLPVAS
jgi:hypothetical protein